MKHESQNINIINSYNIKNTKLLIFFTYLSITSAFTQVPENFKYQALARDKFGNILVNKNVSIKISLIRDNTEGTCVYDEVHYAFTNQYGLINLNIGSGVVIKGSFAEIDWSAGPYFLKIEMDADNKDNFQFMGISQLLSVPFALHAKTADSVKNGYIPDADNDPKNEIQDLAIKGSVLSISKSNTINLSELTSKWDTTVNGITYTRGIVGIGTANPKRNLQVKDVIRLEPRNSSPGNPSEGDIYMDGNSHTLKVYDGTNWQDCW